ncbi:MAG TPA: DUF2142 domain-containing protein [Solirubrobacteraceae bacterium]|nr:DUF2142 domain-containing protein [Solirubrobacteraceae bacterium]
MPAQPLSRASRLRRVRVAALVLAAWALLLAAWVLANPPFAGPDESDHYLRAIGIGQGHLIGASDRDARIGVDARQIAWTRQAARLVTVPGPLDPLPFTCATGAGTASAACLNAAVPERAAATVPTAVGNYQPLPYLLPAAVMRAAPSAPDALRLGRAASALTVFAALALALWALYDPAASVLSLLGLLLAVTPMALFCGAILNGSGLEIASAIAFVACLVRVTRAPGQRSWLTAAAISGAVLALSRPASPVWLATGVVVVGFWAGKQRLRRSVAGTRRRWVAAAILLGAAVALNRVWEGLYGSHVPLDTRQLDAGIVAGVHEWWRALPELVGKFGYLDVKLPLSLVLLWLAGVLVVVAAAMRGTRRDRTTLAAIAACVVIFPPFFYALFTRPTGFGLQGRQLLPALVVLPLLAGEVCYRARARLAGSPSRALTWTVPTVVAVGQVGAWYADAKRFAVGASGPLWFPPSATWTPPLGWGLWLGIVLAAGCCLLAVPALGGAASAAPSPTDRPGDAPGQQGDGPALRRVGVE